jgi:tetrahydromethanopterin S-methyltransferase subunit G
MVNLRRSGATPDRVDDLTRRVRTLEQKVDRLIVAVDRLSLSVDRRFDSIERKLDHVIEGQPQRVSPEHPPPPAIPPTLSPSQ